MIQLLVAIYKILWLRLLRGTQDPRGVIGAVMVLPDGSSHWVSDFAVPKMHERSAVHFAAFGGKA